MKKKSSFIRALSFGGHYKWLTAFSCVLSAVCTVLSVLPYLCLWQAAKIMIEAYPDSADITDIQKMGCYAVLFAAASIIVYFISLIFSHISAFRIASGMKSSAMHHLVKLPLGYFTRNNSGRLRKIIDENASLTEGFFAHQLPDVVGACVLPITLIFLLVRFNIVLGLVCLIPMIISVIATCMVMTPKNLKLMQVYQNSLENMADQAVEYIRGIPVVKVFQQTIYSFRSFNASVLEYSRYAEYFCDACKISSVISNIVLNGAFAFLVPAVILLFHNTDNPIGLITDFTFFIFVTPLLVTTFSKIMNLSECLMTTDQVMKKYDTIFNEKPLPEASNAEHPSDSGIAFECVQFRYAGSDVDAVHNVSFKIRPGTTTALVGESGGGKSTIAALIARFFDVTGGTVRIGGVDIRQIPLEELENSIGFVFQNTNLFKGTIAYNMRMAKKDATDEEILQVLDEAQCMDIVKKLKNGIDTVIGTNGAFLSGGECQRIAIARALLKDTKIILMDEATAFVDPENEMKIQSALNRLTKGKTVLMVAHRLTTVKDVDHIIVISGGEIQEQGTHQELLKKNGKYSTMWNEYIKTASWGFDSLAGKGVVL